MYVGNDDWREVVGDLALRSQLVVIQAGESAGLRWELQMAVQRLHPERMLLFIPFALQEKSPREQERGYQEAREQWAHRTSFEEVDWRRGLTEVDAPLRLTQCMNGVFRKSTRSVNGVLRRRLGGSNSEASCR